jgi:large subunit ribosomal protein L35
MPKQKTKRAAKKRFKLTGAGNLMRRNAMKAHKLEKKSAKRKRDFARDAEVAPSDVREVKKLLGMGS